MRALCGCLAGVLLLVLERVLLLLLAEPSSAPWNVQARPLSSSTMVIQWEEPLTPNGQVTVLTI
jgi:hypothetical protein